VAGCAVDQAPHFSNLTDWVRGFAGTPTDLVAAHSTLTGAHLAVYVGA
jgi:hypothetical protein